jgi:hypothetical protein
MSPAALIFQFFILWIPRSIVWTFQKPRVHGEQMRSET